MSNAVTIVLDDSIFLFDSNDDCDFAGGDGIFTTFNATIMRAKANCRFWYQKMEPGTTIEFYGFTPPQNTDQTFLVTANGSSDLAFPGTYPEPSIGDLFYTSTVTDEELATWEINMHTNGPLLIFDYAVVAVAEYEELQGKTIIVDDSNTEIQWEPEGNWEERRNYTLYGRAETTWVNDTDLHPATRPHGNGTHESDKVGDSLIFQFQGTSILVAGIAPLNRTVESLTDRPIFDPPLGNFNLGLNFTLDGYSQLVTFTNEDLSLPGGSPHFPYFRNDSLSEGNHTLIMTVIDVTGNTSVIIDYLTYNPSFATVRDKPTFSPITISNSTSAPSPSETQSPDPASGSRSNRGAIAGGVVGGVVFLVLLALGVWLVYRKKQQTQRRLYQRESQTMNAPTSNLTIAPFVLLDPTEPLPSKGELSTHQAIQSSSETLWTSGRQQGPIEPEHSFPLTSPTAISTAEQHAELRRERDELEETIQNLESQSQRRDTHTSNENSAIQGQMREMQARIDILTREMSRYIVPPAYDSNV